MNILVIGEVMLELVPSSPDDSRRAQMRQLVASFAGDTYNTAVYLSRLGSVVSYCTAVGDDPYSQLLIGNTEAEGINVDLVQSLSQRQLGLYMVRNLADGEREFRYWRSEAPARELFTEQFLQSNETQLLKSPYLYLSGISLAILKDGGQERLLSFLQTYKQQGGKIFFDSNYRPRLWPSRDYAAILTDQVLDIADVALLTLEDQQQLWQMNEKDAISRCLDLEVPEIIVKRGPQPTLIKSNNEIIEISTPVVDNVIDTTGAGDSFNAGYINARLEGHSCSEAVTFANRCASLVIQHRGAIIPKDEFLQQWNGN